MVTRRVGSALAASVLAVGLIGAMSAPANAATNKAKTTASTSAKNDKKPPAKEPAPSKAPSGAAGGSKANEKKDPPPKKEEKKDPPSKKEEKKDSEYKEWKKGAEDNATQGAGYKGGTDTPNTPPLKQGEDTTKLIPDVTNFAPDEAVLTKEQLKAIVDATVKAANQVPAQTHLVFEGYIYDKPPKGGTDSVGQNLSYERAELVADMVMQALYRAGVTGVTYEVVGHGPADQKKTPEDSRRVEVFATTPDKSPPPTVDPVPERCPAGTSGAFPNCKTVQPPSPQCPTGTSGAFPNCKSVSPPVASCPSGSTGTPPNCTVIPGPTPTPTPRVCPSGTVGWWPVCVVPGPVNPTPVNPTPVNPTPVNPTPVNPAPADPGPAPSPIPVNPA